MCGGYAWGAATLTHLYEQLKDASYFNTKQLGSYVHLFRYETIQIISNHMLHFIIFCIKYFIINIMELRMHGFMSISRAWEEGILSLI